MHLITKGFMPIYTIWTMHGEVGVNVSQENDDVAMPDVALHEAVTNEEPMATINDVFMNTLADDTEHDGGISQLVRNVESGFLSDRELKKLEKMRQDGKTPLYKDYPVSKLEADVMLLEFNALFVWVCLAYKPYFFQPTNSIVLSNQISQQYFQPWLISQTSPSEQGAGIHPWNKSLDRLRYIIMQSSP